MNQQRIIKNNRKIKKKKQKNKSNGKYNTYHGPLSQKGQIPIYNLIFDDKLSEIMLIMSNLLPGFKFVLEHFRNNTWHQHLEFQLDFKK